MVKESTCLGRNLVWLGNFVISYLACSFHTVKVLVPRPAAALMENWSLLALPNGTRPYSGQFCSKRKRKKSVAMYCEFSKRSPKTQRGKKGGDKSSAAFPFTSKAKTRVQSTIGLLHFDLKLINVICQRKVQGFFRGLSPPRENRYESVLYFWSLPSLCLKRCFPKGLLPLHGQFFTFVIASHRLLSSAFEAMMNAFTFENAFSYVTFWLLKKPFKYSKKYNDFLANVCSKKRYDRRRKPV